MYQSANSPQTKSCRTRSASPTAQPPSSSLTLAAVCSVRAMIQRSSRCVRGSAAPLQPARSPSPKDASTNRSTFHSLLAKLRAASSLLSLRRVSLPGVVPVVSANRSASVPYCSIASMGSITLPRVLDIFAPSASRTSPAMYTVPKGTSSMFSRPSMTMRATQKKRMSYAVSITDVG